MQNSLPKLYEKVKSEADARQHEIAALLSRPLCEHGRLLDQIAESEKVGVDSTVDFNEYVMACWQVGHEEPYGVCFRCRMSRFS